MSSQIYSIEFAGYWREPKKGGTPNVSGIYCVYSCIHNANKKTVSLNKLIYIGESEDVRERLSNHEKTSFLGKILTKRGSTLLFCCQGSFF